MLTNGLEALIQKGKAQYKTFTFGGSGVSTIPVPENQFLIITHFDYFHFLDLPEGTGGAPAVGSIQLLTGGTNPINNLQIITPVGVSLPFALDTADVPGSQAAATAAFAVLPGWSIGVAFGAGVWTLTITSTAPGGKFNGETPSFTTTTTLAGSVSNNFAGGTFGTLTLAQVLSRQTHQLQFRSLKSKSHFIIQENIHIDPVIGQLNSNPAQFYFNVSGVYQRDVYLVHTDNVQIDIVNVPQPRGWSVNFSQLPGKSQEANQPVGYGQGAVGQNAVRQIFFAPPTQQYLPLTNLRDTLPLSPFYREQYNVDVNLTNRLNHPKNLGNQATANFIWNQRTHPLVNVGYVLVNMNYNKFVQASNG